MSKLALPVALLALALAAWAAFRPAPAATSTTASTQPTGPANFEALGRQITTRARTETRQEIQRHLREFDERFNRLDTLRGEMADTLTDIGDWIEETKQLSAGGLDTLKTQLRGMSGVPSQLRAFAKDIEAMAARVKAVEDRPPVVREIRVETSGPAKPPERRRPTLPGRGTEDPAVIKAKVAKALTDLSGKDPAVLWTAIEVVRKYKALVAAPKLIEILAEHKNDTIRQNAAVALGGMQSCDAVMPLAKAIASDGEVAQMASGAILAITGFNTELSHSARTKERRKASNAVVAFWRTEETAVRARLGQPAAGS